MRACLGRLTSCVRRVEAAAGDVRSTDGSCPGTVGVIHGDDDQIVPIAISALRTAKIVRRDISAARASQAVRSTTPATSAVYTSGQTQRPPVTKDRKMVGRGLGAA
jgi:hypothetical protein